MQLGQQLVRFQAIDAKALTGGGAVVAITASGRSRWTECSGSSLVGPIAWADFHADRVSGG